MAHIYYQEEQKFTSVVWIWVVIAIVFTTTLVMFTLDENMEDNYPQMALTLGAALIPIGILLFSKLEIRIDDKGLHYRFFPSVFRWRHVRPQMIESFEVQKKKGLYEHLACGYRRNIIKKTVFMNISGKKFIRIKLFDGKKLKIGSENAEGIEMELRRLTGSSEI